METINECPVCKNVDFNSFLEVKDNVVSHETFYIQTCNNCGFKFTNPRPSYNEIGRYYESEEYIYHSNKKKGIFLRIFHIARDFAIKGKLNRINKINQKSATKNILDFGSGTGEFLSFCKRNGWVTKGIETSEQARDYSKKEFGLDVDELSEIVKLKDETFDIITLWHVLEHVHKLDWTIEELKRILKKDGTILIAVPNCSSADAKAYGKFWAAYDPPRHLYHFAPKDINTLFEKKKMVLKRMHQMPLDAFYVSLLSERFKTGKMNVVRGLMRGFSSFLNSVGNPERSSSIAYEIKKNNENKIN